MKALKMSAKEFEALSDSVSNWGRWGTADQRGTLNLLTTEDVVAAAALVEAGETISLSLPLDTHVGIGNPEPAIHKMTMLADDPGGPGELQFAKDYIGVDYHNELHSHIDALCHVAVGGLLYNGAAVTSLTSEGATADAIDVLASGLVGRGVLLDVPAHRGVSWLEPGEHVFREDLEGCERDHRVSVRRGDTLLVRTGHVRRHLELGPWDAAGAKSGLHPTCASFLAEREVAALGSDGNSDTAPSPTEGIDFPIHALTLNSMGMHLLDYLQLDELAATCAAKRRWEFLFVAAPLRIAGGTGSPLNPIAIF